MGLERTGGAAPAAAPLSSFDQAYDFLRGHEGGFTDDPRDPGNWTGGARGLGECRGTHYGISAAAYPNLNIRALTVADAKAIYRRDYWDPARGDDLPPPLALLVFDAAVNSGVSRAVRWLQQAVGVKADGIIGPATLRAVEARAGHRAHGAMSLPGASAENGAALLAEMLAQRALFMSSLPTWSTFGTGWMRRLFGLALQSQHMGVWT